MVSLYIKQLREVEVRKYEIKISNMFAGLENWNDGEDINRDSENIKKNIKISVVYSIV